MAIASSLYSSISGINTMGNAMSVLGDNVANVNTLSFKASRTVFQDVLSQSVSTASGTRQVGRGVTLSSVDGLFAQGSFQSSSIATDMAIGGQGFFMLRGAESSESDMYTRAGEFRFDQEGYLVSPAHHFVQGWTIDAVSGERAGTIGDMRIDKTTPPVATELIEVITNLDSREDVEINEERLFDAWNGTNAAAVNPTAPIDSNQFQYITAIKVYDSVGASHDLSIYFDRTTNDNEWEYLITCDPSEDHRVLDAREQDIYAPSEFYDYEDHKGAGALQYGLIQFDTSGNIKSISAYDVPPDGKVDPAQDVNRLILENTDDYYSFNANFTQATTDQVVQINFGAQYNGITSTTRQTLVSELGAVDSNLTGASYITGQTFWRDVYDSNGLQLRGNGVALASDTITLTGFDHEGAVVTPLMMTYYVNEDARVQEFLDAVGGAFGCTATIDAYGRLKMTDLTGGNSGMYVTSVTVDGTIVADDGVAGGVGHTEDDANPFGETGVNGDTILNITTSKRKIYSAGQGLGVGGTPPVITANTPWAQVYDAANAALLDGDVLTINGFASDGTAVAMAFTVETTASPGVTGTVQDLLDELETVFDADAEIDFAGRLLLTDRRADATGGYTSALAITSISAGVPSGADPWGNAGDPFLTVEADVSGEDGSLEGALVSSEFAPEALATTQYANSSTTIFQDQNGYASGFLQAVAVDVEGIITGHYSNGQVLKKAQVALANFASLEGLFKEGGNIFRETTESGAPVTGTPGSNGLGTIAPNALEQSNVDIGTEFVNLVTVQRGFQANTKIVTTTDEMIADVINMKR
ncbi:MAG: flagellar hook-basal body complex protein [Deltaproteobacteria bacterium]|nr:flagellar hook-basal body complex protein [Deltaproteobacteria bacterium]